MTGFELSLIIYLSFDFCEYFGCSHDDFAPCFFCPHETAYEMYILGLDMLETGDNPLI